MESQLASPCQTRVCKNGHTLNSVENRPMRWRCDGRLNPEGCAGGITTFDNWVGVARYRCGFCNYDLCERCCFPQRPNAESENGSGDLLEIQVVLVSSDPLARVVMPCSATVAVVKSALKTHISSSSFVRNLATEDGRVLEDSSTLTDLNLSSDARLTAALGEFQWEGHWAPVFMNDYRVGDYMDVEGAMVIESDGHARIFQKHSGDYCFKGSPPVSSSDEFTVNSCGKTDALQKMILARVSEDTIRATHGGSFFSWLQTQSAYIQYERYQPGEAIPKFRRGW